MTAPPEPLLADAVSDLVVRFDAELRYTYLNAAAARAAGVAAGDLLGRTNEEAGVAKDLARSARAALEAVLASGEPRAFDFDVARPSGITRIEARLLPERDASGRVAGVIAVGRESTDTAVLPLLQAALAKLPVGVALVEAPTGRVLFRNDEASLIFRRDPTVGTVREVDDYGAFIGYKPDGAPYAPGDWPVARSILHGEVVEAEEAEILRTDGSRGFIRMSSAPVRNAKGAITAGLVTFHDITASRRADRDRAFLASASALLGASLEPADTLRRLAGLAVPDLADWCVVHLVQDGDVSPVAVEHRDPARRRAADEMSSRYPVDRTTRSPVWRVLLGGPAELIPAVTEEALAAVARDPEHLRYLRELGFRSGMVAPIQGRSGVLGALTFIASESGRRYGPEDLALAEDLGRRAGMAIDNARLFTAERDARRQSDLLYRLSDAANRARTPGPVFEAALDAIRDLLQAERASILLFDAAGVIRFVAARGLSEEYRAAVTGHSPWSPETVDPQAIVVPDVREDAGLASFLPVFEKEGIRALAFIPLVYGDRLLGKFMIYGAAPRALDAREIDRAGAIAAQVASAVGRAQAEDALRETDRRKDEFLAMLSHELRNPLAAARNAVHLLTTVAGDDAARGRWVDVIERQTGNLVRLVDDLLDVSRITRGRVELRREDVDLRATVQRAVAASAAVLAPHHVSVTLPEEPLAVSGDAVRLEQIVVNLLVNAGKYTPPGGDVFVEASREGADIVLRVRDTGIGIEPERLARVFELFDQGRRDLARAQGGLGIGLTIVRGLVDLHGGAVMARSEGPGRGTELVVRLPALTATSAAVLPRPGAATASAVSRRVLIVDDHVDSAEMLSALLEAWGHAVSVVTDSAHALGRARDFRPDLVLLDIGLPGLNGYDVAALLRADDRARNAMLVALTGYGQAADRERAFASGFSDHMVKPVQPDALRELLGRLPH